jgi:cytochrome P450
MTQTPASPLHMRRDLFGPADELTRVREEEGVRRVTDPLGRAVYLVTRYEDVREVLGDARRFSNVGLQATTAVGDPISEEDRHRLQAGQLTAFDPPEHTRLRRLLAPEFTTRRMRRLEPRIVEIVDQHLDAMAAAGPPADLVPAFATPIPSMVICELLGVPYADREEFQYRTQRLLDLSLTVDERQDMLRQSNAYMDRLVANAQTDPGEDLIGMLIRDHGDEVSPEELSGIATLLLIAGFETTANMLGIGTLALLRHPDQLAQVRDDPAQVDPAVEELMRWLSVTHAAVPRTTTTQVRLAGQSIPAGEMLFCVLPAANRDPALIEDPDRLDVTRGAIGHLGFGHGVHHCIGAPLARMEMRIAFPALLRRFPDLALAVPFEQVPFRGMDFVYGVRALPLTW